MGEGLKLIEIAEALLETVYLLEEVQQGMPSCNSRGRFESADPILMARYEGTSMSDENARINALQERVASLLESLEHASATAARLQEQSRELAALLERAVTLAEKQAAIENASLPGC